MHTKSESRLLLKFKMLIASIVVVFLLVPRAIGLTISNSTSNEYIKSITRFAYDFAYQITASILMILSLMIIWFRSDEELEINTKQRLWITALFSLFGILVWIF